MFRRAFSTTLVIGLGTVLALVLGEVVLRLAVGPPASFLYGAGYRDVQTDFDVSYGVSDKSRRRSCANRESKRLAAVIGDSFVFGQGVPDCTDFVSLAGLGSKHIAFDNLGVPGIGIFEYLVIARSLVDDRYDAVLVLFYGNDAYALSERRGLIGRLADRSSVAALLRKARRSLVVERSLARDRGGAPRNNIAAILRTDPSYLYKIVNPDKDDLAVFARGFSLLMDRLRGKGVKSIYVSVVPAGHTVSPGLREFVAAQGGDTAEFGTPGAFYRRVKVLSARHGAAFIDSYPAFLAAGDAAYFAHDLHWAEKGHAIMAGLLMKALE